ncbi:DUF4097 domain-containing protein [Puniceicoccaceae bacterium K14]|nr:DUF4097 domain-containing protein [Puniceicoccaceae bacterium K14]
MNFLNTVFKFGAVFGCLCTAWAFAKTEKHQVIPINSETVELPIPDGKPITIELKVTDGDINIRVGDRKTAVLVIDEFESDEYANIEYDTSDSILEIKLSAHLARSDIELTLPQNTNLSLRAEDGDVHIVGIHGEINVKTIDGDLTMKDVVGPITAECTDGNIFASILSPNALQPISLATVDGNIKLRIHPQASLDIAAATLDGDFEYDIDILSKKFKQRGDATFIEGTINSGGPRISLRSVDGNISIKEIPTN